jgi:hypothetical protein
VKYATLFCLWKGALFTRSDTSLHLPLFIESLSACLSILKWLFIFILSVGCWALSLFLINIGMVRFPLNILLPALDLTPYRTCDTSRCFHIVCGSMTSCQTPVDNEGDCSCDCGHRRWVEGLVQKGSLGRFEMSWRSVFGGGTEMYRSFFRLAILMLKWRPWSLWLGSDRTRRSWFDPFKAMSESGVVFAKHPVPGAQRIGQLHPSGSLKKLA